MEESKTECMILSSVQELGSVDFDVRYSLAIDEGLEIDKIISAQTYLTDVKFDVLDKKAIMTGKLITKLVILDKMGVHVTASANQTISQNISDAQIVDSGNIYLRNATTHTDATIGNEGVIDIAVVVFANLVQFSKVNHCVVSSVGEDVQCKMENVPLMQTEQLIDSGFNAECELEIKDVVSKILATDVRFVQTDSCALENAISVSGQLVADILYCVENENGSQIKSVRDSCPVKGEIEVSGSDMECVADLNARVDNTKTVVNTTINTDNTTLNIETYIEVNGAVFKINTVSSVADIYSTKVNMQPVVSEKCLMYAEQVGNFTDSISGELECGDFAPDEIVSVYANQVNITRTLVSEEELVIEGVCEGQVLYRAEDESIVSKSYSLPFQTKHELDGAQYVGCQLSASAENVKAKIRRADLITIDADIIYYCVVYKKENRCFVTDVNVGDEVNYGPISYQIFVAYAGEDLWDVCKRLKVDATQLMLLNPTLELPCKGGEKIFVQR